MPQTARVSKNNTAIINDSEGKSIILHGTRVVFFNDQEIRLDNGGYITVTTQNRMNQASNEYGLGYYVMRNHGAMSVEYNGKVYPFGGTFGSTITLARKARKAA